MYQSMRKYFVERNTKKNNVIAMVILQICTRKVMTTNKICNFARYSMKVLNVYLSGRKNAAHHYEHIDIIMYVLTITDM